MKKYVFNVIHVIFNRQQHCALIKKYVWSLTFKSISMQTLEESPQDEIHATGRSTCLFSPFQYGRKLHETECEGCEYRTRCSLSGDRMQDLTDQLVYDMKLPRERFERIRRRLAILRCHTPIDLRSAALCQTHLNTKNLHKAYVTLTTTNILATHLLHSNHLSTA